ncbi:siderophore-interacting protein [Demetria terragena]|uniref:siderophore-interacting protein n=1 Tax=Demetria terragena TaxID=63959 RepID=UPI0003823ECD|nr:siderophore-interacting protein [Demetria terragena]
MSQAVTATRPFEIFTAEVVRTTRITPHMIRITFSGASLDQFADPGFDQRIKLFLPPIVGSLDDVPRGADWYSQWRAMPEERRAPMRTYTTRFVRPAEHEVDIDLVDHGDLGPASAFARRAQPGDQVLLLGPHAAHPGPHGGLEFPVDLASKTDLLIAGDDTAIPAVSAILEQLPAQARGLAVIEVEHAASIQSVQAPASVRVEWVVRNGARGAAQTPIVRTWLENHPIVGSSEGDSTVYFDGEDDIYWEVSSERGEEVPPLAAWIAGESSVVKALRRLLVRDFAVPRTAVAFMGYWREGMSEA